LSGGDALGESRLALGDELDGFAKGDGGRKVNTTELVGQGVDDKAQVALPTFQPAESILIEPRFD
jgi:hypothetical protein